MSSSSSSSTSIDQYSVAPFDRNATSSSTSDRNLSYPERAWIHEQEKLDVDLRLELHSARVSSAYSSYLAESLVYKLSYPPIPINIPPPFRPFVRPIARPDSLISTTERRAFEHKRRLAHAMSLPPAIPAVPAPPMLPLIPMVYPMFAHNQYIHSPSLYAPYIQKATLLQVSTLASTLKQPASLTHPPMSPASLASQMLLNMASTTTVPAQPVMSSWPRKRTATAAFTSDINPSSIESTVIQSLANTRRSNHYPGVATSKPTMKRAKKK